MDTKNYEITILAQFTTDIEALALAAKLAKSSGELAYLKNGTRDLGFFTETGDYGAPVVKSKSA